MPKQCRHHHHHHHHHNGDHEHHHHGHEHNHQSGSAPPLDTQAKLMVLIKHWIKHNHDHAQTYTEWAQKATEEDLPAVVAALQEAITLTHQITEVFEKALAD